MTIYPYNNSKLEIQNLKLKTKNSKLKTNNVWHLILK